MPTTQIQSNPVYSLPFTYKTGLVPSWASNTTLSISAGQCRDSTDSIDLPVGSAPLNGATTAAPVTLSFSADGVNGLDTGSVAASTMYAIYVIGSSSYKYPVATIATLASNSAPLMPFGYDSYRLIGYWPTNGSSNLILGYVSSVGSTMSFTYDAPQATAITAGAATTYTAVDLSAFVPPVNNTLVIVQSDLTANAAADTLKLQGAASTGDAVTVIAPVAGATAHVITASQVLAQLASSLPKINYKVSTASAAVALKVAAFSFSV